MFNAPVVIAAAICALVVIYFLPRIDAVGRKVYSRYRRRKRDERQERERQERLDRSASPQ
ncbi:hypothetical protein [Caulobacter sp. RL271]|jgi:hypothetical protein|uniref:Uncharacterized protein n=1 Tax=Caulobacter segnis TaxID=88688 RepID=A0ABY5A0L8_9CAUL|nr:hypothetical protein [Caulobacter segnis]USQ98139.1 hypothetical protein MZV50_11605 [Caulobacter segnis]